MPTFTLPTEHNTSSISFPSCGHGATYDWTLPTQHKVLLILLLPSCGFHFHHQPHIVTYNSIVTLYWWQCPACVKFASGHGTTLWAQARWAWRWPWVLCGPEWGDQKVWPTGLWGPKYAQTHHPTSYMIFCPINTVGPELGEHGAGCGYCVGLNGVIRRFGQWYCEGPRGMAMESGWWDHWGLRGVAMESG